MNTNRLIWITTTVLFSLVGATLGWSVAREYLHLVGNAVLAKLFPRSPGLGAPLLSMTITLGVAIIMTRLGSWFADRFIISGIRRIHAVSAVDRILGIVGGSLGFLCGVLVLLAIPMPEEPAFLSWSVKLCVIAVTAVVGMGLLQGMRSEMLRVFPQLGEETMEATLATEIPKFLDTNIIIDGRMAEICRTGFIEGPLWIPNFVLDEVQYIADSADSLRRARGRRGLEVLNAMRDLMAPSPPGSASNHPLVQVLDDIPPRVQQVESVDNKLIALAREMGGAIITNDFNLNRVAELQGVQVLNVNELAQALKPVVLPGEEMNLTIVKEGKEPGQGVGYLEDGTMVVVGEGSRHIGETCKVTISSVYQTVAGKMIFAELRPMKGSGEDLFDPKKGHNGDDLSGRAGGGQRRKNRT